MSARDFLKSNVEVSDKKLSRMDERVDELRMRIKDSRQGDVLNDVFDGAILMVLYELSRKGHIDALSGSFIEMKE